MVGQPRSQAALLGALLVGVAVSFVLSITVLPWLPVTTYFLWLLVALLVLRPGPVFVVVVSACVLAVIAAVARNEVSAARWLALVELMVAGALVVLITTHRKGSLPVLGAQDFLADLRARLDAHSTIPPLPSGWQAQSAMLASAGGIYTGDFLVAHRDSDGDSLEVILVDVCGSGAAAAPAALQFAGALNGMIGSLGAVELFAAANRFLLRQSDDEHFATAVHLEVDLTDGSYTITSAGHPPAMRFDLPTHEWVIDNARGTALGVTSEPELHRSEGRIFPGEALMFYTDGVIETRNSPIDAGIAWLQRIAKEAVHDGFPGAAKRVMGQVSGGDDDRAVLILSRDPISAGRSPG
ncbi:PP2C family protein-serine/threonine phosphatase [Nocardioides sp.]|uniref:PP2C family protein-serine/threonine phosphatase n=1 Tax=Nocardioides sp. TaxID=35761 RepID=UPI0035633008